MNLVPDGRDRQRRIARSRSPCQACDGERGVGRKCGIQLNRRHQFVHRARQIRALSDLERRESRPVARHRLDLGRGAWISRGSDFAHETTLHRASFRAAVSNVDVAIITPLIGVHLVPQHTRGQCGSDIASPMRRTTAGTLPGHLRIAKSTDPLVSTRHSAAKAWDDQGIDACRVHSCHAQTKRPADRHVELVADPISRSISQRRAGRPTVLNRHERLRSGRGQQLKSVPCQLRKLSEKASVLRPSPDDPQDPVFVDGHNNVTWWGGERHVLRDWDGKSFQRRVEGARLEDCLQVHRPYDPARGEAAPHVEDQSVLDTAWHLSSDVKCNAPRVLIPDRWPKQSLTL
eukprot:3935835-Rhodomonas_salina.2